MSKVRGMRALALLAALSVTGCSRECGTPSAKAEVGKSTPPIEKATEPEQEGMPETVKYVAANENRLIAVATQVRGRVTDLPADRGARVSKGNPLVAQSAQRTPRDAEVEELAPGLDLGKAWVEIERIGGRYARAGEKR